jgi:uncharacterized membrane protein YedE/YeeE
LLAFAFGVSLTIVGFAFLRRRLNLDPVRFHKGTIPGAALFGIGWAVTGVCPGVALIQIGQGIWMALVTLTGIFAGIWIHSRLKKRFGLSVSGC